MNFSLADNIIENGKNQESEVHKSSQNSGPNVIDLLLGKEAHGVIDSETLIQETQKRVWAALKQGYEYAGNFEDSEQFFTSKCSFKNRYGRLICRSSWFNYHDS